MLLYLTLGPDHEMFLVKGCHHMQSLTISDDYTKAQFYLQYKSEQTIPREGWFNIYSDFTAHVICLVLSSV